MALVKVDLTGAIEAGQEIVKHATAGDIPKFKSTIGVAGSNVGNYLSQVVVHDDDTPGPVLAGESHALHSELYESYKAAFAEPAGSVLSETWKTFYANLVKWLLSLGIKI